MSDPKAMARRVAQTGGGAGGSGGAEFGRTSKTIIKGVGHLAPFENPAQCSQATAEWIARDLKVWEDRRKFEKENKDDKSLNKVKLSGEWMRQAQAFFRGTCEKREARIEVMKILSLSLHEIVRLQSPMCWWVGRCVSKLERPYAASENFKTSKIAFLAGTFPSPQFVDWFIVCGPVRYESTLALLLSTCQ